MLNTYMVGEFGEAIPLEAAQAKLVESVARYYNDYIDPLDALRDDDTGELWRVVGGVGDAYSTVLDEGGLQKIRQECRRLAVENEFAINGHENRINYVVGTGHVYTVVADKGDEVADDKISAAQDVLDRFTEVNKWPKRQQEIIRRKDRDGECFLRFFFAGDTIKVRFVEPGQVATPAEAVMLPNHSFGIITSPEDVETVEGYYVDGVLVPADDIQHRKANVDMGVKRGLPLYFPVRKNLKRAGKLLRNMSITAEIQTAIAMIRKHPSGQAAIQSMVEGNADASVTRTTGLGSNQTRYLRQYAPGTILDAPENMSHEFPAAGIDASRYVLILQAELRAIASRLVMPEFMLTSDASNANYSSTMVAEGPAVKQFQRIQWDMIEDDKAILNRVLDLAVVSGELDANTRDVVRIDVEPPRLITRNRKEEVDADVLLVREFIMSLRSARIRNELDPDVEEEQIEEEREARDPFAGMENPLFAKGQQGNVDDEGKDDDE